MRTRPPATTSRPAACASTTSSSTASGGSDAAEPEAADALRDARSALTASVVDALYARHPEWDARWGRAGRESTTRDTAFHWEFLEAALRAGNPEVFARYSAWLADVLRSRRVPIEAVHESYDLMVASAARLLGPHELARVREMVHAGRAALAAPPTVPGARARERHPQADALLDALLRGDRRGAQDAIATAMREGGSATAVADALIQPTMTEIGRLWQQNKVSVAQEHLATAIVQTALARAFAALVLPAPRGKRALFACVEGNHHSLGLRLVADAFEAEGWEARYLGADVPTRDLVGAARDWQPDLVGLSLSLPQHVATARRAIAELRASGAREIVVGGIPLNDHEGLHLVVGADAWYPDAGSATGAHR